MYHVSGLRCNKQRARAHPMTKGCCMVSGTHGVNIFFHTWKYGVISLLPITEKVGGGVKKMGICVTGEGHYTKLIKPYKLIKHHTNGKHLKVWWRSRILEIRHLTYLQSPIGRHLRPSFLCVPCWLQFTWLTVPSLVWTYQAEEQNTISGRLWVIFIWAIFIWARHYSSRHAYLYTVLPLWVVGMSRTHPSSVSIRTCEQAKNLCKLANR